MSGRPASFNQKERARLFALRGGRCYLCSGRIDATREAWEIEHEMPWEISRDNTDDNLQLAHKKCHAAKTAVDAGVIAKVKRIEAKHKGFWPKSKTPLRSAGFQKTRLWAASRNPDIGDEE